jgi:hypothetical protein
MSAWEKSSGLFSAEDQKVRVLGARPPPSLALGLEGGQGGSVVSQWVPLCDWFKHLRTETVLVTH